jgi:hypothetical protein
LENRLLATGTSQAEAWYHATLQAREVGLLAPTLEPHRRFARDSAPRLA